MSMRILVTNDDGILSRGIVTLVDALSTVAEVVVIAPDRNNSGVSSAITLEMPLRVTEVRDNWWQLNGTPVDCVKLALSGFLQQEPDMVISGINAGANLGDDVLYSGTVGGALEGRFLRLPAIAVSCVGEKTPRHYDTAAQVVLKLLKQLRRQSLPAGMVLNVNVPNCPMSELKGMRVTRQGDRHFSEPLIPKEDGRGRQIYWLGAAGKIKDSNEGTDFHAVHQGYASVTPLQFDMTKHSAIGMVQDWLD